MENKKKLEKYLFDKFSMNYARDVISNLEKIFVIFKAKFVYDVKKIIDKKQVNVRGGQTAYRVFLNFCDEFDVLNDEVIQALRNKIKLNIKVNMDTYVPTLDNIKQSLKLILELYRYEYVIMYKLIVESGCRPIELKQLIESFDKSKVEYYEKIVTYRNFYLRGSKNSYYLFFSKQTFDEFEKYFDIIKSIKFETFKEHIVRNGDITNLKYLRKYNFTCLIREGVDFEIANFIQGRASKNIGFNHYLAKKEIGVKAYSKIVDKILPKKDLNEINQRYV